MGFAYPAAKTAKGMDGKTIRVGDTVISKYGVKTVVVTIHRQGRDGTIITSKDAPNPRYPNRYNGKATNFKKVDS